MRIGVSFDVIRELTIEAKQSVVMPLTHATGGQRKYGVDFISKKEARKSERRG